MCSLWLQTFWVQDHHVTPDAKPVLQSTQRPSMHHPTLPSPFSSLFLTFLCFLENVFTRLATRHVKRAVDQSSRSTRGNHMGVTLLSNQRQYCTRHLTVLRLFLAIRFAGSIALAPAELNQIGTEGQPCTDFGIHARLPVLKELYDLGEAAFVSNVGALAAPLSKHQWENGAGERCLDPAFSLAAEYASQSC